MTDKAGEGKAPSGDSQSGAPADDSAPAPGETKPAGQSSTPAESTSKESVDTDPPNTEPTDTTASATTSESKETEKPEAIANSENNDSADSVSARTEDQTSAGAEGRDTGTDGATATAEGRNDTVGDPNDPASDRDPKAAQGRPEDRETVKKDADAARAGGAEAGESARGELEQRVFAKAEPPNGAPVRELRDSWNKAGEDLQNAEAAGHRVAKEMPESWQGDSGRMMRERAIESTKEVEAHGSAARAVRDQLERTSVDFEQARARGKEAVAHREDLYRRAKYTAPDAERELLMARVEHDAVREVTDIKSAMAHKVREDWTELETRMAAAPTEKGKHSVEPPPEPGSKGSDYADFIDSSERIAQPGIDLIDASQDLENISDRIGNWIGHRVADAGAYLGEKIGGEIGESIGRDLGENVGDDFEAPIGIFGEVVESAGGNLGNTLETVGNAGREIGYNASEKDAFGAIRGVAEELGESVINSVGGTFEQFREIKDEIDVQYVSEAQEELAQAQDALEVAGDDPAVGFPGSSNVPVRGDGPVTFYPRTDFTPQQMAEVREHVRIANEALARGKTWPTGRRSTKGSLRRRASEEARRERARAKKADHPYRGDVGHVPDTTWTGKPQAYAWHDETSRVNSTLGGQASRYPIGWKPTEYRVGAPVEPGARLPPS